MPDPGTTIVSAVPYTYQSFRLALDSHSDVTITDAKCVYNKRKITENVSTGGGKAQFTEEGYVDIDTGNGNVETIPTLVSNSPTDLPRGCTSLIGAQQLRELNISLDAHMWERDLPLQCQATVADDIIYHGQDVETDDCLQMHLGEKDLLKWYEANKDRAVNNLPYTLDMIQYYTSDHSAFDPEHPALPPEVHKALQDTCREYSDVFDAAKGQLPKPADHPPVELNFKDDWKHVQCGRIRWGPGSRPIVAKWAQEQLDSGLYEPSKSPSASRPHAVKKPPPGSPKDVDITKCGIRMCGDYRKPNEQLKKSVSTLPLGPEELAKLGGYDTYWVTDQHYGMYHAHVLAHGPSRELLAIDTPIGIIQPTRLIEGEKNAGQVASTPVRTKILSLPDNAGDRAACFVDDQAQGNNFVDSDDPLVRYGNLLKGWRDYLQMCRENNFTLNPSKTKLGFPSATFYGFEASKKGFTLADKNLDPIRKMVPPANLSELRHVLGVFVQSKNYFPDEHPYAQTVKPLTALTGGKKGNPVPFIWTATHQKAFDTIRDLLLSGLHLAAPDFRLPFHAGGDASEDGKSFGLWQFYDDKVASGKFKVVDHGPDHTTVLFDGETKPYSIPHSLDNRRQTHNFSKCWENDAQSTRAPY